MIKQNKISMRFMLFISTVILVCFGCKKGVTITDINEDNFLRVYQDIGDQNIHFIKPLDDGGLFLIGTQDLNAVNDRLGLFMMRVDALGILQWKKTISGTELPNPIGINLSDGCILINATGRMVKVDMNGNIIFNTIYENNKNYNFTYTLQASDSSFFTSYSNGWSQYNPGSHFIVNIRPNGTIKKYFSITDATFGFKNLMLNVYNYNYNIDATQTYYFCGFCIPNFTGWTNYQAYIAKFQYSGLNIISKKVKLIPTALGDINNSSWWVYHTSNNKLLYLLGQTEQSGTFKMHLIKANDSLDIEWEKDIRISANGTNPAGINECPDGNYLIFGTCKVDGKLSDQPFLCKMDTSGNIIWQKIYHTALTGMAGYAVQKNDGGCWYGGSSTGFGKGVTKNDVFLLKTDKEGNLK